MIRVSAGSFFLCATFSFKWFSREPAFFQEEPFFLNKITSKSFFFVICQKCEGITKKYDLPVKMVLNIITILWSNYMKTYTYMQCFPHDFWKFGGYMSAGEAFCLRKFWKWTCKILNSRSHIHSLGIGLWLCVSF